MRPALHLYRRLIGVRIRAQFQDRVNFFLDIFSTGILAVISFLTIALVLQRFDQIAGWTLWEVAFLYGMVEFAFGFMDMIFSGFDPQFFGTQVRLGKFDQMLLRPVNIVLQVFGSEFIIRRLGRIAQAGVILGLAISNLNIQWTPGKTVYLPLVLASMVAFFGGLFVLGAGITFFTIESIEAINIFTYGGTEMMAYPMTIYQDWMRRFFTYIVPAIFLNYYPSIFLLGKPDPFGLAPAAYYLAPLAGFGTLAAGLAFWQFGLRHYQSTGT